MVKIITSVKRDSFTNPVVLVTSPNKNNGKTFISSWFAITSSLLDYKTLCIKIPDPESKDVYSKRRGLINYFNSTSSIDEWNIIWKTKWDNLFYIPPGYTENKDNEISKKLNRNKIEELLSFAKTNFDLIVLDGGSLPYSMETITFIQDIDVILLVIASKRDKVKDVQEILELVDKEKVRIILNYVPERKKRLAGIGIKKFLSKINYA